MLPIVNIDDSLAYPSFFKNNDIEKRILFWGIELNEALMRGAVIVTKGYFEWLDNIPFFRNFS